MNPSQAFFESFVNVEHKLLGRVLQPLCLRHLIFLEQIENPLVFTSKPVAVSDLEIAAIVCSSTSETHSINQLGTQKLSLFSRWKLKRWRKRNLRCDVRAEVAAFLAYQDDYLALPDRYERDENEESDCAISSLLLHAAAVIQATGWSEETVFNMPVGKVLWLNIAFSYLKTGKTDIISDKEAAAMAALTGARRKE